jgi:hypothetical protein
LRTANFTAAKKEAATVPAKRGETIHERKILMATGHCTDSNPLAAIEKPMIDPTISCVVDTGYPKAVAMNNMILAANNAENIPYIRRAGSSSYISMSTILDRMVPVTAAPKKYAPENSKIAAITTKYYKNEMSYLFSIKEFASCQTYPLLALE